MSELIVAFEKGDVQRIIDCLYVIGGERGARLTDKEEAVILLLANDDDPEVRETVAACVGLRVGMCELYPILFARLKECESDNDVRVAIIRAISYLASSDQEKKIETSRLFARVIIDENDDDEVRGCAYACLLNLLGKTTKADYAAMPWYLSEIDWDKEFVQSVLRW